MNVLGLDMSCESSGVALPTGDTITITAPPARSKKKRVLLDDLDRLGYIAGELNAVLYGHRCELAVLEDYAPGVRSSAAHRLAEVGGATRITLWAHGVPLVIVGTRQLKLYATGKAGADKGDMRIAALKRTGVEFPNDDECDAWWLRAMALDAYGAPVVAVPVAQREVLTKIAWPIVDGHELAVAS